MQRAVTSSPQWSVKAYDAEEHNCFAFVLAFLRSLKQNPLSMHANQKLDFCTHYVLPKTTLAGKYICLYRKIKNHGGLYVTSKKNWGFSRQKNHVIWINLLIHRCLFPLGFFLCFTYNKCVSIYEIFKSLRQMWQHLHSAVRLVQLLYIHAVAHQIPYVWLYWGNLWFCRGNVLRYYWLFLFVFCWFWQMWK